MKPSRFLLVSLLLSVSFCVYSQQQQPAIVWQKSLGGSQEDRARSIMKTPDGGVIVVGFSKSNDGDVTGHHGATTTNDAWAVKLDASGNIEWQRSLGGTSNDEFHSVVLTPEGTYLCFGFTNSTDGDVVGKHGSSDVWLVNLSRQGNIIWQKCLGGNGAEGSTSFFSKGNIRLIRGFYYIVTSTTSSATGDVTGINRGDYDIWFAKVALDGTVVSDATLGGSRVDRGMDVTSVQPGRFILAIESESDDGTIGSFGGNSPRGGTITIDSTGFLISKNASLQSWTVSLATFGTTVFPGRTLSNCVPNNPNEGVSAIVTFATCQFNISLPNYTTTLRGPNSMATPNGVDLVVAASTTEATIHGTGHGSFDGFVSGQKLGSGLMWKKLIGGSGTDMLEGVAIINETEVIVAGYSNTPNNGDVTGNHGNYDFWVVKLGQVNKIKGTVYLDYNLNGVKDATEPFANNALIESKKNTSSAGSLSYNGIFSNIVDTGAYTTKVAGGINYYVGVPASYNSDFTTYNNVDSFSFAMQPIPGQRDYKIKLSATNPTRPGMDVNYEITYSNIGTDTLLNKTVKLIKDSRETFQSAIPAPASINGDTITWNISQLNPRESGMIRVVLRVAVPPAVINGDILNLSAVIDSTGDLTPKNNLSQIRSQVVGSWDPNDKNESLGGSMLITQVPTNDLIYTIRFQNTGNDTAFTVVIKDTLDAKLDFSSIEMVSASHDYVLEIKNGNILTWTFNKILLVDSVHNEPASHGYVTYSIRPKSTVVVGDIIPNNASIYFDFNLPVKTNTHLTEIKAAPVVLPPPSPSVTGMQSEYCNNLGIQKGKIANLPPASSGITATVTLNNAALAIASDSTFSFDVNALAPAVYQLEVIFRNSAGADTLRRTVAIRETVTPDVNVSANITNAVNLADPVIVTAANAAGGGSSPLYTFAKDRNMSNVLQAEGSNNVLNINPTTLSAGDNWIYVRMKTSSTCFTAQHNVDSINIRMQLPVPPQPVINGMLTSYCSTSGIQKGKLGNYPVANTGATVTVKLDGNTIALAADTSFSFNPGTIGFGEHAVQVTFANPSGTKTSTAIFTVSGPETPNVQVITSKDLLLNASDQATLTASATAGGGIAPLYTFAKDRGFTHVLQPESATTTYTIGWNQLSVGNNWFFVKMKTSSNCVTQQTAIDSVLIVKSATAGLVDPDFPNVKINSTPNPFRGPVTISGLAASKSYTITIHNMQGRQTLKMKVVSRSTVNLNLPGYMAGTYLVSIYDETKKRIIGTLEIVKQ